MGGIYIEQVSVYTGILPSQTLDNKANKEFALYIYIYCMSEYILKDNRTICTGYLLEIENLNNCIVQARGQYGEEFKP